MLYFHSSFFMPPGTTVPFYWPRVPEGKKFTGLADDGDYREICNSKCRMVTEAMTAY